MNTKIADRRKLAHFFSPGGLLVCQIPSHIPRRRLYRTLRTFGFAPRVLYHRLGLFPMRMTAMPDPDVRALTTAAGARVLKAREDAMASPAIENRTYDVTNPGGHSA
jgi:hypothetical protein